MIRLSHLRSRLANRRANRVDPLVDAILCGALLLYQELEPGDILLGISITVRSGSQFLTYSTGAGETEIARTMYDASDPAAILRASEALAAVRIDATVRDMP